MSAMNETTRSLGQRGLAVIEQARRRALLAAAMRSLRERDAYGNETGTLPYTDEAIARFALLHQADPEDTRIIHHLAIAHHSRAWDWELAGDSRAAKEWEKALTYWRMIETSAEFWAGLKARYAAHAGPGGDTAWLDQLRASLLDQLLEIHADFICAHSGTGKRQRALEHVGLVRRARIPPVARERLLARVFAAMTSSVPDARQRRDYEAALSSVSRFGELFPEYLAALRLHVEIVCAWLGELSYEGGWPTIVALAQGARPVMERLAAHPQLATDPLARSALLDLGLQLAFMGDRRGGSFLAAENRGEACAITDQEAEESFALGMEFGRLVCPLTPRAALVRMRFAECAKGRAILCDRSVKKLLSLRTPDLRILRQVRQQIEDAGQMIAEAIQVYPEDKSLDAGFRQPIEKLLMEVQQALTQGGSS